MICAAIVKSNPGIIMLQKLTEKQATMSWRRGGFVEV